MRHFGYFMTESTGHLSEYVPWFRKNRKALDLYCDQPDFGGASGAYYHYCAMIAKKYAKVNYLELESPKIVRRSVEYWLVHSRSHGDRPPGSGSTATCATTATSPTCRRGLRGDPGVRRPARPASLRVGALPTQCAALNLSTSRSSS